MADALRGYLSDDVWGVAGKLDRVAGAPVLSKNKDHMVGRSTSRPRDRRGLVERLKKNLNVDVALLLHGKVVAAIAAGRASWTRCPSSSASTRRTSPP